MSQIFTGARARFYLNGVPLGFALGVTVTENIAQEPIVCLDNIAVQEHVPTGYTVQLRARIYKIPLRDLVSVGLWPQAAANTDTHKTILTDWPEMTAQIFDTQTDTPVAKVYGVKPTTRVIDVQARAIVMSDCTFVARLFSDEGTSEI